ncbi:MAG: metabolite traffic protein EboE [Verrucomicrobiota bacterium]
MRLKHGLHLAYCTNIHRGETWTETLAALERHTLAVRDRVSPADPYAIGLRLSHQAACELSDRQTLLQFQRWLDRQNCYVFTINGFPYGPFHGTRVKEHVYQPDWTTRERLEYTNRLFDLLSQLAPPDVEGSVSTVPCSFKDFIHSEAQERAMRGQLWRCVEHIAGLCERSGRSLHLGLEPEPLCYLETSDETVRFFDRLRDDHPRDERLNSHLGVNYDNCHLAVEFEEPADVLRKFSDHQIRVSKLHFSSALKVIPTPGVRAALKSFLDPVYFHQVIARKSDGTITRYKDLDLALAAPAPKASDSGEPSAEREEWRIHFHVPLHCRPTALFDTTADHILGVMDHLQANPRLCSHLEMETYTWEVLPPEMKNRNVVDQLVSEYDWTLRHLAERGLADLPETLPAQPLRS